MEPAVRGIFVFVSAQFAHTKFGHGRLRAIVWNISNDGVARAAVGAIGKGIAVAPVCRITKFAPAIFTGRDVWGNENKRAIRAQTFLDYEFEIALASHRRHSHVSNIRERRRPIAKRIEELLTRNLGAFDLDRNSLR
jgi:hypothetical protein